MRKKIENAAKLIVLFMILATSIKCQKDDDLEQTNDKTLLSAKGWFKSYEAESSNFELFQNLDHDWNSAVITNSEDGTKTIIVPINEIKKDPTETWEQKLYIYKLGENNYEALLFEIYPDSKNTDPESSLIDSGIFTGYMAAWDLKKGFVKAALFENGKVSENGSIKVYSKNKSITGKAPSNQANCPAGVECDTDGSGDTDGTQLKEVVINNNYQNPLGYVIIYNSNGGGYAGDTSPGGYTNHGTGASDGGGGITAPTPVQIIDALTGKAKCLNTLLNKNGNSFVQKLLANFTGKSEFNIQIVSVDKVISNVTKLEINGRTEHNKGSTDMKILISTTRANENSTLETVRVILHEYIHADIFRKTYTTQNSRDKEVVDFRTTYNAYIQEKDHSSMAALYINSMKEALKEFHKKVLVDDYNKYINYYGEAPSDAFYEAFAWGGLKDDNVKPWTDLPEGKKTEINALASRAKNFSKEVPCPN